MGWGLEDGGVGEGESGTDDVQQRVDHVDVVLHTASFGQDLERLVDTGCTAIGTVVSHGPERVGDGDDPRLQITSSPRGPRG